MQEKMKIKPGFTIFIAGAGTLGLLNARLAEMARRKSLFAMTTQNVFPMPDKQIAGR